MNRGAIDFKLILVVLAIVALLIWIWPHIHIN